MYLYTKEQLEKSLQEVDSIINKCNKVYSKFEEGTSQHTLLKNRIKAMHVSRNLLIEEIWKNQYIDSITVTQLLLDNTTNAFTNDEYIETKVSIESIIYKCQRAIEKHTLGSATYTVLKRTIEAMFICKVLIDRKLE